MLHPLASPLWAETWAGAPPLMLIGADADLTVDDAVDIGVRARDEGVEVDLCVWPRMFHDWLCYTEGRDKEVRTHTLDTNTQPRHPVREYCVAVHGH
eukprot:COSAG01_NODE_1831_length_9117_cov_3.960080_2_plen_97_part_00